MDKSIDVDALKAEAQKLLQLTIRIRKYQQFLNFIRQNWLTITLMAVLSGLLIRVVQTGLRQPFDLTAITFAIIVASITSIIIGRYNILANLGFVTSAGISAIVVIVSDNVNAIIGIIIVASITGSIITFGFIGKYFWEKKRKYYLPFLLLTAIISVTIIFSCLKVPRGMELYERKSGKYTSSPVFLTVGSGTLEENYFIVKRKPQKEVSVWIWFPPVKDSGWSYERETYSFRGNIILTCAFKNYKAYERIQGTQFPELPVLAKSQAQAPEAIKKVILMTSGLTSEDIEITKIDGLE